MFRKQEIKPLLIALFVVTLAFAFDDKSETFRWGYWLLNFIKILILVAIAFLVHEMAHKWYAGKLGFSTVFDLWNVKRFSWRLSPTFPRTFHFGRKAYTIHSIPLGIVLSLIITFFSNGALFFIPVSVYRLVIEKASRIGKRFYQITEYEEARIAMMGPLANILLALILKILNFNGIFDDAILINGLYGLYNMIPLAALDGSKILYGSRLLYVFGAAFILLAFVLLLIANALTALIASLIFAVIAAAVYYYFMMYR
ncbi:hypothetical protein HZB88_03500 [archaeon]|nr:hypothetical protein [archaeon]